MSIYTYKLKGARWLRMWTAADRSSVYAAQSEAQKIADTLCDVPWTRAKSDGPAMFPLTAAKSLDENPANRDLFDAALFCAEHSDGAHRAYANAAMYLFKLPSTSGVNLKSVTVHVESDAYNALGARIAVHLLSSAELPTDCATVRAGAAHAEGVAARRTVERDGRNYWYSNSADVTITGGTSESPAAIGDLKQYLAVFVGLENYATSRNEWLEGASYIRNLIEIETDAVVTGWTAGGTYDCSDAGTAVLLSGGSSPTWLQPPATVNAGASAPQVPASAEQVDTFYTPAVYEGTAKEATWTIEGSTISKQQWSGEFGFKYTVNLRLTGKTGVDGTATIIAADERTGTTVEETVSLMRISGYIGFVSSVTHKWYTGTGTDYYVRYLQFYMKAPFTYTETEARTGTHTVSCSKVKAFEYSGSAFNANIAGFDYSSQNVTGYREFTLSTSVQLFDMSEMYWLLRMAGGVPKFMDACDLPGWEARRNLPSGVSGSAPSWTVTVEGKSFAVDVDGQDVTLTSPDGQSWSFTLSDSLTGSRYFDASASLRLGDETVAKYGMAAAVGDFSHAAATFEAGAQPGNAEVLGRLARTSRKDSRPMLYLHPESGALADELDALRPVPRFWRTGTDPSGQTSCQPGLSVWYRRPATPSDAALGIVQRDAAGQEGVVSNPAFLQLALLALRAPSAFAARLVLENKTGASTNGAAVANHFKLRFVAWRSPAEQWDGSNAFAMAAMASMPSVYRSDGPASVAWNVDCTGSLLRFGTRDMTADRVGVSKTVSGEIAAGAAIEIPLVAPVGEGDVVLIAPEVLGFADGAGGASKWFGRSEDPATATDAGKGWARYAHNLGWFPRVTGI